MWYCYTDGFLVNMQFDSDDTYSLLLYGGGALVALWLSSAIVGAIDSIPLVRMCFGLILYLIGIMNKVYFAHSVN
jgi:hypothetical protein